MARKRRLPALLAALALVLTSCGRPAAQSPTPSAPPTEQAVKAPAPTAEVLPAPAASQAPAEPPAPVETAAPAETPAPVETPPPAETPVPVEASSPTPEPAATAAPTPTDTPVPSEAPTPEVLPTPAETPGLTVVGPVALVYLDGYLYDAIDLGSVTESYTYTVKGFSGLTNDIEVAPGKIRVCRADCPDKICVSQGWLDYSFIPIACLPNSLIIEVYGTDDLGLDGMAG